MYARTVLPAPVSGFVAKRAVQLGQRVSPGAPLMAIVPLDQVWVDANFKEPQLAAMRVGQPVHAQSPTSTAARSSITARSPASAPAPARRSRCCRRRTRPATGSRSCSACRCASRSIRRSSPRIRCRSACRCRSRSTPDNRAGERLPQIAQTAPAYATDVFHSADAAADEHVKAIIAGNGGGATRFAQSTNSPLAQKPTAMVERAPDLTHTKTVASSRDHAL